MAFFYGLRVDFGSYAYHTGDVTGLWLSARHAAETCRYEQHTGQVAVFAMSSTGIEYSDSCAVYDALRPDIHVRTGSHLSVLAYTEGIEALPVVGLGVIGYYHAVCHDYTRSVGR